MFDIGFSELLVVFVVALIILGPERLPIAAKTAGLWIRKIRRTISTVQREINAQLDQEELQQKIEQTNKRILKEGNDIQNMITPLPESMLAEKADIDAEKSNTVAQAEENTILQGALETENLAPLSTEPTNKLEEEHITLDNVIASNELNPSKTRDSETNADKVSTDKTSTDKASTDDKTSTTDTSRP